LQLKPVMHYDDNIDNETLSILFLSNIILEKQGLGLASHLVHWLISSFQTNTKRN
jgi:hypothetical protein